MAGKQMTSDSFSANLAGMSKNQLYDIMSQMKILIEQNQQQARQILVDNPALTKALFQAQIMLGMVQPPQAMPSIQQTISQPSQQSMQPGQPPSVQAQPVPAQVGRQEQTSTVQTQMPSRKKQPNQPVPPIPSASVPPVNHQSQTMPSHSLQSMQPSRHMSTQGNTMSLPPSSQGHTMPPQSLHSAQQPLPYHQSQVPSQPQQSLHSSSGQHPPLQPPLPPQPRPPPMQPFQHQFHSQMGPHGGFQPPGPPQPHHSQQPFSAGNKHPGSISYTQGQPPLPNQPLPHSLYQVGGSHLGADLNNQGGSSMQVDRGSWMPGPPENSMGGVQLPGPPPVPGQMGLGSQPSRQSQLTPEMEQALQQVMSITPEQVSRLPPEQRQQVLQLQQMMR